MAEKLSNIKDRVLQIAENKEIAKETFFKKIGVSYGNFKGKSKDSSLSSAIVAEISTNFPDVSLEWLILGKGSMIKNEIVQKENNDQASKMENKYINLLEEHNQLLKENAALKERLLKLGDTPKATSTRRHSA